MCLYSHGAGSNYECISEEVLLPLRGEVTPRIRIDLSEQGIDLRTRLRLAQELNTYGERRSLVEGLDIFIMNPPLMEITHKTEKQNRYQTRINP